MASIISQLKGTAAEVAAKTYAAGVLVWNETAKRWHGGDGVTPGGIAMARYDERNDGSLGYEQRVETGAANSVTVADIGKVIIGNRGTAIAFNLDPAASLTSKFTALFKNIGAGAMTVVPNGAQLIDGVNAPVTVPTGSSVIIKGDGASFRTFLSNGDVTAAAIHSAAIKASPTAADELGLVDSAASWILRRITLGGLLTWLLPQIGADYVQGLTLSNSAANANNGVDVSVGQAKGNGKIVVSSAIVGKRLDVAWTAGGTAAVPAGGLDTGTKAINSTYHAHSIVNDTTGAFDVLLSLSASAPTVPSGWTRVQRLGAVLTDGSGNVRAFTQNGNRVTLTTFVTELTETSLQALSAITLSSVPAGVPVRPILSATLTMSSATANSGYDLALTDGANVTSGGLVNIVTAVNTANNQTLSAATEAVVSNTSRQIGRRTAAVGSNPTSPTLTLRGHGWSDISIPRAA